MLGTHISVTNPKLTARKVGSPPHKKRPIPLSVPKYSFGKLSHISVLKYNFSRDLKAKSYKTYYRGLKNFSPKYPLPKLGRLMEDLETNFDPEYPAPPKPRLKLLMEDLKTLV